MSKRTWNPKSKKRVKKHGFLRRMATRLGKLTIKRRRSKGRKRLAISL